MTKKGTDKEEWASLWGLVVGVLASTAILSAIFGTIDARPELRSLKHEAVERGHAIHDPMTGEWRWVVPEESEARDE